MLLMLHSHRDSPLPPPAVKHVCVHCHLVTRLFYCRLWVQCMSMEMIVKQDSLVRYPHVFNIHWTFFSVFWHLTNQQWKRKWNILKWTESLGFWMPELSSSTIYVASAFQEGFLVNGNFNIRNLEDCFCLAIIWLSKLTCVATIAKGYLHDQWQNSMVIYLCLVSKVNLCWIWCIIL